MERVVQEEREAHGASPGGQEGFLGGKERQVEGDSQKKDKWYPFIYSLSLCRYCSRGWRYDWKPQ